MEIPRRGLELELQLPASTTAAAAWDPSHISDLHHSPWQCRSLNPLSEARDHTRNLVDASWMRHRWPWWELQAGLEHKLCSLRAQQCAE